MTTTETNLNITIGNLIAQKVENFILYCEKIAGKDNKLYPQLLTLREKNAVVSYAKYLHPIAVRDGDRFTVDQSYVKRYLIGNGFNEEELNKMDDGNFIKVVSRYLSFFITMMFGDM